MELRRTIVASLLSLAAMLSAPSQAQMPMRFSDVYFFGDSIVDTGNWLNHPYWSTDANAPTAAKGYWEGRWQSGPSWADYLAQYLGLTAEASSNGGTNYAFGASGTSPHPSEIPLAPGTPGHALYLSTQIDQILADHGGSLDDRALYVFNIGNNDPVIFGRTPAEAPTAAGVVITQMQRLFDAGARLFMVRTLAPGLDPYATPFNQALLSGVGTIRAQGGSVFEVDALEWRDETVPRLADLGITILSGNCRADAGCLAAAATAAQSGQIYDNAFLNFDAIAPHLNHVLHQTIAQHALRSIPMRAIVPVPTLSLPGIALLAALLAAASLGLRARRRMS